jgi:hypothetical protein
VAQQPAGEVDLAGGAADLAARPRRGIAAQRLAAEALLEERGDALAAECGVSGAGRELNGFELGEAQLPAFELEGEVFPESSLSRL